MRILDEIFDDRFLVDLVHRLNHTSWYPNNIANRNTWPYGDKGTHKLLGHTFFYRKNLDIIEYSTDINLSYQLIDSFYTVSSSFKRNLFLQQISGNLQFAGMDGTNHIDGRGFGEDGKNVYSYILMLGDGLTDSNDGGEFINETLGESVSYKLGRVIEIYSDEVHRGNSFRTPNRCRYSIKFTGIDNFADGAFLKMS